MDGSLSGVKDLTNKGATTTIKKTMVWVSGLTHQGRFTEPTQLTECSGDKWRPFGHAAHGEYLIVFSGNN
jgi:hypothetical protein